MNVEGLLTVTDCHVHGTSKVMQDGDIVATDH